MKKLIVAAAALAVAVIGGAAFGLSTPAAHADPTNTWVINLNVAAALHGSAVPCTAAGADAAAADLDAIQTASAGQVSTDPANAGAVCIIVETDGSTTPVTVNARGLTVGAVDGPTAGTNGTFAAIPVTGVGTFVSGNTVTVTQDSIAVDTKALTKVQAATNFQLTVVKGTIQEGATSCGVTDATTAPTKSAAVAVYTDINGTALVGYATDFAPLFTATGHAGVAIGTNISMLLADGTTTASYDVVCGKTAGTQAITATAADGQVSGVSGDLVRSSTVTITGVPASIALTAAPAAIACNGTNTSTVTATVTDSAGNQVVDGTSVTFSVVALGTANPVTTTTTGGTASSVITPLSGTTAGTVVTVSAGTVSQQITIACQQALLTPTAPAAAATATPKGGVVGPNTGTGGYLGSSSSTGFPMWALAALALASVVLVGGGVVVRRTGK